MQVSLVNWVKEPSIPPTIFMLDGEPVDGLTPELRSPERSTGKLAVLSANRGRCFQGPIPVGDGFIVSAAEPDQLLKRADAKYRDVVRPYLTGEDIAEDPKQEPRRWTIDFAQQPLQEAAKYPVALAIVRQGVKPARETIRRPRKVPAMVAAAFDVTHGDVRTRWLNDPS